MPNAPLTPEQRAEYVAVLAGFVRLFESWDNIQALADRPPRSGELRKVIDALIDDDEMTREALDVLADHLRHTSPTPPPERVCPAGCIGLSGCTRCWRDYALTEAARRR